MNPTQGKWLITGGCGFIGTALIRSLLAHRQPSSIVVMDNLSVGGRKDLARVAPFVETESVDPGVVRLVVADVTDPQVCQSCCEGVDVVVHLAANTGVGPSVEDPRGDMTSNVVGTFNMLEAARACGVARFIFASSGAPLGEVTPPIHEGLAPRPVSPYGASKLAGEGYCSAYGRTFGVGTVALRFGNVFGRGSLHKESVVAKFFKRALRGEPLEVYGDGSQTRDFIYLEDLLDAIILAAKSNVAGEIVQIASGGETTVNALVEVMKRVMAERLGQPVQVDHGPRRVGDVHRNYADVSKAKRLLGWEPTHTLEEGLRATLDYFIGATNGNFDTAVGGNSVGDGGGRRRPDVFSRGPVESI